ncbi:hypothetical protein FHS61_001766 [Altererythrobacter atlanticus]|uniref:Uncharacterized protein n=1 Tax=Croceibacterium atlanticum TaxID=1267766 RepID=A0A0F7KNV0_9SPHN|nr:hypothetical protein [Croceibacterium atlanticum]AKH41239.1 hypothetical protein WYH_00173 [Croceibacterium atlanticum]MBB5732757.1 hypothetical protein [Croceibacterium atlanticum]
MNLDGVFICKTKTPIGVQDSTLTFVMADDGQSFTGTSESNTGTLEFLEGRVDGARISWKMDLTKPIRMTLRCEGELLGDELRVVIHAGAIGKMPLHGVRAVSDRG